MTRYEILTKLTYDIAPEIELIFNDHDDGYYEYETDTINIDVFPKDDMGFLRHLKVAHECEFAYDFPFVLWTLLHELGHYFTLDDIDTDEDLCDRILCSIVSRAVAEEMPNVQDLYYNIPSEWVATEWAIDYITENWELCTEIAKELA